MSVPWPIGVEHRLQRSGYQRTPEDIVLRLEPDAGPALRYLIDGSRRHTVTGTLRLTRDQAEIFRAWRRDDLRLGSRLFNWVITDTGEWVTARLLSQPDESEGPGGAQLFQLEIETAAPVASVAVLQALAALDGMGPAEWSPEVPFRIRRQGYARTAADRVLRGQEGRGLQEQSVTTLGEGRDLTVSLRLTQAEKAAFEVWFETVAAFGARAVRVPFEGGLHQAVFAGGYTIAPSSGVDWLVEFPLYLEAVA